jgi:hypothetical protein
MYPRRLRRLRQRYRLAASVIAAAPLPALAADPALSAWGAYLFFAIVATVVIVLLLHEAQEDEPMDDRRRDEQAASRSARDAMRRHVTARTMRRATRRSGASREPGSALRVTRAMTTPRALAIVLSTFAPAASGATGEGVAEWLPWLVLGAIVLLVAGIALRMFIAARFPKGYTAWARSRREDFAERNAQWDDDDKRH